MWAVFHLASLHCGGWVALIATGVVATNPSFYVMSTEVLTEIPYTLGVLVVLLILSRSTQPETPNGHEEPKWVPRLMMVLAIAALGFTPWLRTAGISLVVAVGIWSFTSRSRFQWIPGFAVASVAFGILAWRNKQAGGENYIASILTRLREQGPGAVFLSGIETIWHYLCSAPGLLLPGITSDRPWYSPLTLDGSSTLGIPFVFAACIATVLITFGLLGMCNRRSHGGSLALIYIVIYCACLIVWPWRHERFLWPLIPVLMSYVPTGIIVLASCIPCLKPAISFFGTISLVALFGWQSLACQQIAEINREFTSNRDAFHATRNPGFYFSNWRRAGEWLNAHTPPSTRVLTWHAAVAGTSHRFQKRVQFETLSPEKVRQQIESFSARYLVVPAAHFGDGFGWQQVAADPAIRLSVVYCEQDVAILEVVPNRTGEVSKDEYPKWLEEQLFLAEDACKRNPQRIDLAIRRATLLREAGDTKEAIRILTDLLSRGAKTVRICSELGWLFFDNEEYAEAARFLDMARTLPNAESIASMLSDGVKRSYERMQGQTDKIAATSIERQLNRIKGLIISEKYATAERELDRILTAVPENPEALFIRGKLDYRIGENSQAEDSLEKSFTRGYLDAQQSLFELRYIRALSNSKTTTVSVGDQREIVDPTDPASHLRAAKYHADRGWTGRALATLENANNRFPDDPSIQIALADRYRQFARPELAVPLYQSVLKTNPGDVLAKKGLETAQFGLIEPAMFPRRSQLNEDLYVHGIIGNHEQ
jgi:tetratricopeptide (TPR) repeat protein